MRTRTSVAVVTDTLAAAFRHGDGTSGPKA